jgi:hypothetical protein
MALVPGAVAEPDVTLFAVAMHEFYQLRRRVAGRGPAAASSSPRVGSFWYIVVLG